MKFFLEQIQAFLPAPDLVAAMAIPSLLYAIAAAAFCGWMRVKRNIAVPYTRKTFHLLIFSAAGWLHACYGLGAVSLFGGLVFLLVLATVLAGKRWWFYSALARPSDQPYEKRFIVLPLLATALGGVLGNVLFPATAFVGYFVGGWGDAVGEPVGTRWGRHRYTVPTLFGVRATRSIEGSVAVALVSGLVCYLVVIWSGFLFTVPLWIVVVLCGLIAAGVEAISSHGLDNLTIQFAAAGVLTLLS